MKNKQKVISIKRETKFIGERRVGLDTNILVKLYDNPFLFDYEESRIFRYQNLIFIHVISKHELIRYLIQKGLKEENAKSEVNNFIRERNIQVIYPKDIFIQEREVIDFEQEVNKKFREIGNDYLECHKPDSIIILAFKKININRIISTDKSFRESAKFIGIDSESIPSLDSKISSELRKIFDYKKKYRKIR